jgi:hypothetical protein
LSLKWLADLLLGLLGGLIEVQSQRYSNLFLFFLFYLGKNILLLPFRLLLTGGDATDASELGVIPDAWNERKGLEPSRL